LTAVRLTVCAFVLSLSGLHPVQAAQITACEVSRASLSPDGTQALLYTPLRYERSNMEISAVDQSRRYMPATAGLGGVHLVRLDCSAPGCAATTVTDMPLAPWTDPAWSTDGQTFALPITQGDQIAGDATAIALHDAASGAQIARSDWLAAKLLLPPALAPDLSGADVGRMRAPDQIGDRPQVVSLTEAAAGPDRTEPAPFMALGPRLLALDGLSANSGRLVWGEVALEIYPARRSHALVSGSDTASALVSRVDLHGSTEISHLTRVEARTLHSLDSAMRMVVAPRREMDAVIAHGNQRALALSEAASPLVDAINSELERLPVYRLGQMTVSQDLAQALLILNREKRGRRIILIAPAAPARDIVRACEATVRGPEIVAETFKIDSFYGAMPVSLLRRSGDTPSRVALLAWPEFPLEDPDFAPIDRFGPGFEYDLFQIEFPALARADEFETADAIWEAASGICASALAAISQRYPGAYEAIGVVGRGYGGLVAVTAMVDGGCGADFAAAFGPVLAHHGQGSVYDRPRRDGLGHHPLEDAMRRLGPVRPNGVPRRDASSYIYAAWPDSRYDPKPIAEFVGRLATAGADAYWHLPVLSGLPPRAFASAPRPTPPFTGPDALEALALKSVDAP
jgi:hypothetical protein